MLVAALLMSGFGMAHAGYGQLVSSCLVASSAKYKIHPHLLWAIASHESGFRSSAIGKNSDGSFDLGVMQINTSWLPRLQAMGISKADLFEPCTNIEVGAWILANNIQQYGYTWNAVGAYNARSEGKRKRYAIKVWNELRRVAAQ